MPPRIRAASTALSSLDASLSSTSSTAPCSARTFTTTACREHMSTARFNMHRWLKSNGKMFEDPRGPSYLGPKTDQPFPNNSLFRSQTVLSEASRELIWKKVLQRGEALKSVSEEMGVDVRRVAAVVRMKQIEKQWTNDGKRLAIPYAQAVMKMLPQSEFLEGAENKPHEPINDIPVHKLTMQQLFVPVSESRQFTREDAAQAFHETMLSADERSAQKELITMERKVLSGGGREKSLARWRERVQKLEEKHAAELHKQAQREEEMTTRVKTDRYEFRFKDVNADDAGKHGRSRKGFGWRYGAPLMDRKRGQVKIPTSVP